MTKDNKTKLKKYLSKYTDNPDSIIGIRAVLNTDNLIAQMVRIFETYKDIPRTRAIDIAITLRTKAEPDWQEKELLEGYDN